MDKKNLRIKGIIYIVVIMGIGFGTYKYNNVQAYNNLITTANKYMDHKEYDKAITLFEQSFQYKKDANIKKNIKLATNLKESKVISDNGIKLMNDKKYLDAIEQFKKITKEDDELYIEAQNKMDECKKQFIAQNIQLANDAAKNNKYDEANKYSDDILKLDANNADAKNLKDTFAKKVKEQQNKAKAQEKAKKASLQIKQEGSSQDSNSNNNSQYNEYENALKQLELQITKLDIELGHLDEHSDAYINKLEEKKKILYQEKEIIKKMQSILGN